MPEGGGHEDGVLAVERERLVHRPGTGELRVVGVRDALLLARRSRREEKLRHRVRRRRPAVGARQRRLRQEVAREVEGARRLAVDDDRGSQGRHRAGEIARHLAVAEATEARGDEQETCLGEPDCELDLAPAMDRHQWADDRADPATRQGDRDELPPVGQLQRDHVARDDPLVDKPGRNAIDDVVQLGIAQAACRLADPVRDDRGAARIPLDGAREVIDEGRIAAPPARIEIAIPVRRPEAKAERLELPCDVLVHDPPPLSDHRQAAARADDLTRHVRRAF